MTSKSCTAEIKVSTKSAKMAGSIRSALAPDLKHLPKDEGRATISLSGASVIFKVETPDLATLRASINSYLGLADASYRCTSAL